MAEGFRRRGKRVSERRRELRHAGVVSAANRDIAASPPGPAIPSRVSACRVREGWVRRRGGIDQTASARMLARTRSRRCGSLRSRRPAIGTGSWSPLSQGGRQIRSFWQGCGGERQDIGAALRTSPRPVRRRPPPCRCAQNDLEPREQVGQLARSQAFRTWRTCTPISAPQTRGSRLGTRQMLGTLSYTAENDAAILRTH